MYIKLVSVSIHFTRRPQKSEGLTGRLGGATSAAPGMAPASAGLSSPSRPGLPPSVVGRRRAGRSAMVGQPAPALGRHGGGGGDQRLFQGLIEAVAVLVKSVKGGGEGLGGERFGP